MKAGVKLHEHETKVNLSDIQLTYRLAATKQHDAGFDEFICGYHSYDRIFSPVSISNTGFQEGEGEVDCVDGGRILSTAEVSCCGASDDDDVDDVDKNFNASVGVLYSNKR